MLESQQQPSLAIPCPYPNLLSLSSSYTIESGDAIKFIIGDTVDHDISRLNTNFSKVKELDSNGELELLIHQDHATQLSDTYRGVAISLDVKDTSRIFDGMYVGRPASLANLQLRAEEMAMCGGLVGGAAMKELMLSEGFYLCYAVSLI